MQAKLIQIPALALTALLSGCVGTGPNTQEGAVTGATLGALAGAIIGNNSGSHNGAAGALIGAAAGAMAGGTVGNSVDHQNGTVYGYPQRPYGYQRVAVPQGPPPAPAPLADTVTPAPSANAVWIPGYWDYNGSGYTWSAGHWEIPPANAQSYVSAHWENRGGTFFFIRGAWQ
ncbi:MAG: glycine zipper 2TM domain-containing protein [Verrucomicrobia bacterium]|nr:glycine zipper 2TM domain-containing protein [Verrucomicrobiota bacterium]